MIRYSTRTAKDTYEKIAIFSTEQSAAVLRGIVALFPLYKVSMKAVACPICAKICDLSKFMRAALDPKLLCDKHLLKAEQSYCDCTVLMAADDMEICEITNEAASRGLIPTADDIEKD